MGDILNDYLSVSLNADGSLKTSVISDKADNASVIHSSGDESIAGTKTFTSSPVVPEPTTSTQVANKAYVDTSVSNNSPVTSVVGQTGVITGDQIALDPALKAAYISPLGKTTTGSASNLTWYNVADYGLKADNGTTDNSPLLASMLASIPDGSTIQFPTNGIGYYGFGSCVTISKPVTLVGNWGRASSISSPVGVQIRPIAASYVAGSSIFRITTGRVKIHGLALTGKMASDASAVVSSGSNTISLSSITAAAWMVGCAVAGASIAQQATGPTTITSVNTSLNTITISANATGNTAGINIYAGSGIEFAADSHQSKLYDCLITQFFVGVNMGAMSDHITLHDCEVSGNYDNILFGQGNNFDYAFYDCNLTGAQHASVRLYGPDTSTQNILFSRTHLGFSPYGMVQDTTASNDGYAGVSFVGSPIESITKQHICIVNGGSISVDGTCYWGWDNSDVYKPALTAFEITGLQDFGPIDFQPQLLANHPNPNSPQVIQVGNQNGFPIETHNIALNGFAQKMTPYTSYIGLVQRTSAYFHGDSINTGNNSKLFLNGGIYGHAVSKSSAYSTQSADFLIRCTGTFTLTLGQRSTNQMLFVTNEGSGTITLATSAGSYIGPATIAAGHGATYISDGTNWRCVGSY